MGHDRCPFILMRDPSEPIGMMGWRARVRSDAGQAFTEYTMILALLAMIIVALTNMIVPASARLVVALVRHMAIYLSSVRPGA